MEPIKINVNVEIGLKQTTIDTLRLFFGPQITAAGPCLCALDEEPHPKKPTDPAPAPAPAPATVADDDDLPEAPAPKQATPSENDARQAVKAARDRGVSAKVIKEYMQSTFGIASSVECPADRRAELIKGLANLAA
jgi:hypothetical protein